MNSTQQASLTNIQNQVKGFLGIDTEVYLESEKVNQRYGVAVRFKTDNYSPEITRYYGKEIKEVDSKELLNAYAMAFNKVPAHLVNYKAESTTDFLIVEKEEGEFILSAEYWYEQPSQRRGIKVEGVEGEYCWVLVNSASAYFFKPNQEVKIKISKELVGGLAVEDDWNFYSSWMLDKEIDPNFYGWVSDTELHYAKQEEVWKAEILK